MNKAGVFRAVIASVAVTSMGAGLVLRLQRDIPSDPPRGTRTPVSPPAPKASLHEGPARSPRETSPSQPTALPLGQAGSPDRSQVDETSLPFWRDAQAILEDLVGDERRRRECLNAFVEMVGRVREIENARVRYLVEGEKTVIEIPAFREEGRAIRSEWRKQCLALLTSEEVARFTTSPDFETGRLSPELDLLRVANLFSGSRHGKEMEPDFFWDDTTRIEVQALGDGNVQVRTGAADRITFSQFESQ